jgi:hypothetical protein
MKTKQQRYTEATKRQFESFKKAVSNKNLYMLHKTAILEEVKKHIGIKVSDVSFDREIKSMLPTIQELIKSKDSPTVNKVYVTQGGGSASWNGSCYVFDVPPEWGDFTEGDPVPREWDIQLVDVYS